VSNARNNVRTASNSAITRALIRMTMFEGQEMKKVIFAVLLTALALFLIVPSLSWAF